MSLGAMVAVAWAAAHPDEIAGAVLVNTSLRPFSPFHHRLRPANYPALLRLLLQGTPRQWEETVLRLTSNKVTGSAGQALLTQWLALREQHPVSRGNALRQLLAAARYTAPKAPPRVPLLVLNGEGDHLVSPRCSVALATQWGCELRRHPQAGHDLPLDDGDWVARTVSQWMAARGFKESG
jgi:pimeloyl-ACP methyl ester carboxylesterase